MWKRRFFASLPLPLPPKILKKASASLLPPLPFRFLTVFFANISALGPSTVKLYTGLESVNKDGRIDAHKNVKIKKKYFLERRVPPAWATLSNKKRVIKRIKYEHTFNWGF